MMRSALAIVFGLGLGLVACAAPATPVEPVAPSTPPEAPSSEPPAAEEVVSTTRKRTRTSKAVPPERDGTKPKNGRTLNPRDAMGRTVFVRADDHCFVEVKEGTELVDCPPETNDPAYDHCTAQLVLEEGTSKCYCVTGAGTHRMPRPTTCPKGL
ncbi:MAG: hypothetical protein KIT84_39250 [Labilithrix sp.]|nr:hypothetical protein [Labilithrix sp.]MCW5817099.1 hypothetical protein [Labilithrix sp.]